MKDIETNTWSNRSQKEFAIILSLIVLTAVYRILPHPYNFAPVAALALFGGACLKNRFLSVILPLAAMVLSDVVIGFHSQWMTVYACFALIGLVGGFLNRNLSFGRLLGTSFLSSLFFFLVTNFEIWARTDFYTKNLAGLTECYILALPFFQRTLAGDLVFTVALFGIYAALTQRRLSKATA